jgi:hypothetical protein
MRPLQVVTVREGGGGSSTTTPRRARAERLFIVRAFAGAFCDALRLPGWDSCIDLAASRSCFLRSRLAASSALLCLEASRRAEYAAERLSFSNLLRNVAAARSSRQWCFATSSLSLFVLLSLLR